MKSENRIELLPFYFGTVEDGERLRVERKLLEEQDLLVDYFDLKREIEAAEILPSEPSERVWKALSSRLVKSPRRRLVAISLGVAVAASLVLCVLFLSRSKAPAPAPQADHGILFGGGEPASGGGVL